MKLVEFGSAPVPYIRETLAQGRTLARMLLDLPLEMGAVRAFVPDDVNDEAVWRFTEGGLLKPGERLFGPNGWTGYRVDRSAIDSEVAAFVGDYIRQSGRGLFEHALANASDPWLSTIAVPFCTHDDDVYFITEPPIENHAIGAAMRAARSYLFTGVLARGQFEVKPGLEIPHETLRKFAVSADHVLIGTYDGEGELIWSRR